MGKKILRSILFSVALMVIVFQTAFAEDASGTSGQLTWVLDGKVLTISGEGAMGMFGGWQEYADQIEEIIIENGAIIVNYQSFKDFVNLKTVSIPDSVTLILPEAFSGCTSLETVTISKNNGITDVQREAFKGCSAIKSALEFPSVTKIGEKAFYGCSSIPLVSFGSSLETIDYAAFEGCSSLGEIIIPDSVVGIGDRAFANCTGVKKAVIGDGLEKINDSLFSSCSDLETLTIGDATESIGEHAFEYCTSLSSVKFGNSVSLFATMSFYGCTALEKIVFPVSTAYINANAFSNSGLNSILITGEFPQIYPTAFINVTAEGKYYEANAPETIPASTAFGGNITWTATSGGFILSSPEDVSAVAGTTVKFSVKTLGSGYTYQWQASTDKGENWNNSGLTGNKTDTLSVKASAARNGYMFRCVVTDGEGVSEISDVAELSVDSFGITTQPKNVTVNSGEKAVFTVAAAGTGLKYQWRVSTNGGMTWGNTSLSGNKTAKLTVDATMKRNGYQFKCEVSNDAGDVIESNIAILSVNSIFNILTDPVDAYVVSGDKASFTVQAEGTGLKYQWQVLTTEKNATWKSSRLAGNKTATLSFSANCLKDGYKFRCVVTNEIGQKLISGEATIGVFGIKYQPKDLTVSAGSTAVFSLTAKGSGLTFQWYASTDGGKTWNKSSLTGNKTRKLSVKASKGRNGYQYHCVITDSNGNTVTSDAATLYVE